MGPHTVCDIVTVGITENTLKDMYPTRQAVDELGHQMSVLEQKLEANLSHSARKNSLG